MAAFITVNRRNDQSGNDDEPNQPIMSTTAAAEENDVRDSFFTHSSENESEEEEKVTHNHCHIANLLLKMLSIRENALACMEPQTPLGELTALPQTPY